jgi:predicted kinase
MTSATAARLQSDPRRSDELQQLARDYIRIAGHLLHPPGPCLIAVGGLSGSGKSRLALALAPSVGPAPGALVVRSDEVRKRLLGVPPLARLDPEGYAPEVSRRVYVTLAERAGVIVRQGHAAIVDAVFARPSDRDTIEQVATAAGVPFAGLWLDAPESVLIERADRRRLDPSDADAGVIRSQLAQSTGSITWHRIDASPAADVVLRRAATVLEDRLAGRMRIPESETA